MAGEMHMTPALSDALTILGAAGIVIPAFARLKISPVIGFILVGIVAGPFALGAMAKDTPWLEAVSITDPGGHRPLRRIRHHPAAVLDRAGTELQAAVGDAPAGVRGRRRRTGSAAPADRRSGSSRWATASPPRSCSGWRWPCRRPRWSSRSPAPSSPVGRAAFAMLLFEDLALVPLLFLFTSAGRREGHRRPADGGLEGRAGHRRDAGRGALPAPASVRAGGAHQEPRTVPRGQPARRDPRQPRDQRGRPQPDPRRARRRRADRRDRISQRGRTRHRPAARSRARRVPDHRRHAARPQRPARRLAQADRARLLAVLAVKSLVTAHACCGCRGRAGAPPPRPAC